MKEYQNSLPEEDELYKYPKDSKRNNFDPLSDNNNNYINNNNFNNNFENNKYEKEPNDNKNANLIMDNNEDININHYQYAQDLNKDQNSQNDNNSEMIKQQEEINYSIFKGFLVKVYGIISVQLLITLIVILIFQKESIKNYFIEHESLTGVLNFLCVCGFIVTLIILAVKQDLSKQVPYNYISLFIMTIFLSFMCAFFSLNFSVESVIFCIVLTAISSIAITIYAYYSTTNWGTIKALLFVIIGQSGGFIFFMLIFNNPVTEMVMCLFGTLLFGVYLVYDTQIIMRKYGTVYGVDDYIFASIQIYLDIINLFMIILSAFGNNKK